MPGKMTKFRYRLLRALIHPQVLSLVFAVIVTVAWVHWRKPVGELKLNSWVAVIFLAIIFRPSIVELLRRTDKISTSWAQLSMKRLEEDVEKAESIEETNHPKPIRREVILADSAKATDDISTEPSEGLPPTTPNPFDDPTTIREQAAGLLEELPHTRLLRSTDFADINLNGSLIALRRLQRVVLDTERLVLHYFGPEDGPYEFTPDVAEYMAVWTGVSGWTNVVDVWRRAKDQVLIMREDEISRVELRLVDMLVDRAKGILVKQLEAVVKYGRTD